MEICAREKRNECHWSFWNGEDARSRPEVKCSTVQGNKEYRRLAKNSE